MFKQVFTYWSKDNPVEKVTRRILFATLFLSTLGLVVSTLQIGRWFQEDAFLSGTLLVGFLVGSAIAWIVSFIILLLDFISTYKAYSKYYT